MFITAADTHMLPLPSHPLDHLHPLRRPAGCLGAAFAGLKGAANLKQLTLFQIADTSDLPHLEQLSQVTYLYLGTQPGTSMPLVLDDPPSAPLAALGNLKELQLPWGWCLTGEDAHTTFNDYNCPLAFPPNLTSLQAVWVECSAGALWRHIAACTALEELELSEDGDGARSHPSWALRELAGGLGRLRKLVIKHDGIEGARNPVRRLRQLVHLLYLPQEENVAPGALEAALALALPPMPVAGLQAADAANHMMLPPPNMEKFSSLEVLQLPGGTHGGWWLMASAPHHWQALAGCKALRQLEGLHASLPPPAEVKFPGVTRLEVTVAPGDALRVLGAFPALRELKITSVVAGDQQQVRGQLGTCDFCSRTAAMWPCQAFVAVCEGVYHSSLHRDNLSNRFCMDAAAAMWQYTGMLLVACFWRYHVPNAGSTHDTPAHHMWRHG
jgi:hypothetical protein